LKLTFAIFAAHPAAKVKRRVQKLFLELGKIRTSSATTSTHATS
jgi:hypothetical protein